MTDKIKSAINDFPKPINEKLGYGVTEDDVYEWFVKHAKTILKALSAYEKLQEVDLDTVKEIEERWGNRFLELEEPVPEGMKRGGYVVDIHFLLTQLKSAQLVADIGGDG